MYRTKKAQKNDDNNVKYAVFEQLLEKGVLQSVQQQMKKAITDELKLIQTNQPINHNENPEPNKIIVMDDVEVENDKKDDWKSSTTKITNWEKQIRYELDIEREIQTREIERQKEKIAGEWKKLNERDKTLTIELSARERIIKQKEDLLKNRSEDIEQKLEEIASKEQMVNDIISQKLKLELKDEIEKLRKKFNELEQTKANLTKREEKLSEAESRLQQQIIFVKQTIDSNREMEIDISRLRREIEIIAKENEKLKQCVANMDDYLVIKHERSSLEKELIAIKHTLKNKIIEFESEREKFDNENKLNDEKILKLRMELRKCSQQLVFVEQKYTEEIDEWSYKYEQVVDQLKNSKTAVKQLIIKNQLLSKELISIQNASEIMMKTHRKTNTLSQTAISKVGCHICDHNTNIMKESSLEFFASAPECFTDLKLETQQINEQTEKSLQSLQPKQYQLSNDSKQSINRLNKIQTENNPSLLSAINTEKEIKDKTTNIEECSLDQSAKQQQHSKDNVRESYYHFSVSSLNNNQISIPKNYAEKTNNEELDKRMLENKTQIVDNNQSDFFDW